MVKIKSLADLQALKAKVHKEMDTRIKGNDKSLPQIKVAMGTSGIASGAKEIFDYMLEQTDKKGVRAVVTMTDYMGYQNQEPTVEVDLQGKDPVIFGNVDKKKADEIIEKYISKGEAVEGIIK